jgi:acyl-CoA thioester hydrolase
MPAYVIPIQIRWSDIDANRHMRHSVYYDYGAMARMMVLSEGGLTTSKINELKIGPILFREEAVFKREVHLEDKLTIDMVMAKATPDYSRWTFRHNIIKGDGTVAAILTADGAWIDLEKRKLASPDDFIKKIMEAVPRTEDFQFVELAKK